ncbi:hypothetical protein AB1L88_15510 [Tautonia sp. JC769]|uniref:hypothetical protein n=1 Tax=Tautonia sp. JC769 TaxID=3232135 RepID=UPI003458B2FF
MPDLKTMERNRVQRQAQLGTLRDQIAAIRAALLTLESLVNAASEANEAAARRPRDPVPEESARRAFAEIGYNAAEPIGAIDAAVARIDTILA